jgi:hypothetical protein
MKQKINSVFLVLVFAVFLAFAGCSKNDGVLGPNFNSQVSISISQQSGPNGGVEFLFKPGRDVNISKIVSRLSSQQFTDTLRFTNTSYVYSKDTTYIISEYSGVENGQKWNFDFTGSVPGQNGSNYNVTSDYTVQ